MEPLIEFYSSDLVDALYYFEYHGPLKKRLQWIEKDDNVNELYKLIRQIKVRSFKRFMPYVRKVAVQEKITDTNKLLTFIKENPPRGAFGERIVEDNQKYRDVVQEIYNLYCNKLLTKDKRKQLEKLRKAIKKKYTASYWKKFKEESEKLPGISWKRKNPIICLVYPIDGRLSFKANRADIAYIETSKEMLEEDSMFLHEVVKLANYTRPIGSWVRQDKLKVRAVAYELFTEMQTLRIIKGINGKAPNFKKVILDKLEKLWIPLLRPETSFDGDELEVVLNKAFKMLPKHEFDAMFQMGELYTELNIIRLT